MSEIGGVNQRMKEIIEKNIGTFMVKNIVEIESHDNKTENVNESEEEENNLIDLEKAQNNHDKHESPTMHIQNALSSTPNRAGRHLLDD
ncbi:hypothetical protein BpHYR1_034624 [Brachionus plicatilis]|uniref:Uncharacterized protein n=1 Tax=Brachionus plicatilis TaxID=10195 RepID=A0A3M7T3Z1_BRAPC|nr:hypothetical protein BpHYR1_034624 [Brachionus plicatilis]